MKPGFERLSYWSRTFASFIELTQWLCAGFAVFLAIGIVWLDPSVFAEFTQALVPGVAPPLPVAILITYALLVSMFFGCVLTAKMWQYIRKIFEISAGNAPDSIGPTPFQPENVRLLKKIASFAIITQLINVAYLLVRIFAAAITHNTAEFAAANVDGPGSFIANNIMDLSSCFVGLVFGLIIFCLAQFFAYGIQLQLDSDGLV